MRIHVKLFFRFFLSYALVMLVPLLFALAGYRETVRMAESQAYESDMTMLEQSGRSMDGILSAARDMMQSIASSNSVKRLLTLGSVYQHRTLLIDFIRARNELGMYRVTSNVDQFLIYAKKSDSLVSDSMLAFDIAHNITGVIQSDMAPDALYAWLSAPYQYEFIPSAELFMENSRITRARYVGYASSLKDAAGNHTGTLVMLFNEQRLLSSIGMTGTSDRAYGCVLDDRGRLVVGVGDLPDVASTLAALPMDGHRGNLRAAVAGRDMLVSWLRGGDYGLIYVSVMPMSNIAGQVDAVRMNLIVLMLSLVAIGLILSFWMTQRNTAPLRRLLSRLQAEGGDAEVGELNYVRIDKAFLGFMDKSRSLQHELLAQQPLIRSALTGRWLNGEILDADVIVESYARAGVDLSYRSYVVIVLSMADDGGSNLDRISGRRTMLRALMREELAGLIELYDMDFEHVAAICGRAERVRSELDLALQQALEGVLGLLSAKTGLHMTCAMSFAGGVQRVHLAYLEAQQALTQNAATARPGSAIWYQPAGMGHGNGVMYYPIELEVALIDALRTGSEKDLSLAFSRLYSENAIRQTLGRGQLMQLVAGVNGTLSRAWPGDAARAVQPAGRLSGFADELDLDDPTQVDRLFQQMQSLLKEVCSQAGESLRRKRQGLRWQLEEYIAQNFRNPQLSLQSVADQFGYTGAYLSRFFKEQTGELFSAYVENLRMQEAAQMLREGRHTIRFITEAVGYNSPQAFRRVFIKRFGKTPSEFTASPSE